MKLWGFGKHSKDKSDESNFERQNGSPQKREGTKTFCCDACGKSYSYSFLGGFITAPEYKQNQSNQLMEISGRLSPLEYKTLYGICVSCARQLDRGFEAGIEVELDQTPAVWGVLTCSLDDSSNIVPMRTPLNHVRPVNIMRLKVIKSIAATEAEKKAQKP